jgi:hypothetical protein
LSGGSFQFLIAQRNGRLFGHDGAQQALTFNQQTIPKIRTSEDSSRVSLPGSSEVEAKEEKKDPLGKGLPGIFSPMVRQVPRPLRTPKILRQNARTAQEADDGREETPNGTAPFVGSAVRPVCQRADHT